MQIISISGLDGSGKSTQIEMLKNHLESQGEKVFYFHAVSFSFPQKIKEFSRRNANIFRTTDNGGHKIDQQEKSVTQANRTQIILRKIAFLIDVVRFWFFKKDLTSKGYDFLLSDRYFYDNIINIAYLSKTEKPSWVGRFLPKADTAFYLSIRPETIMTRSRVPDQGIDYLKDKKKLYETFAPLWKLETVDGEATPQDVFEKILISIKEKTGH